MQWIHCFIVLCLSMWKILKIFCWCICIAKMVNGFVSVILCSRQTLVSPDSVFSRQWSLQTVFSPDSVISRQWSLQTQLSPDSVISRQCSLQTQLSPDSDISRPWLLWTLISPDCGTRWNPTTRFYYTSINPSQDEHQPEKVNKLMLETSDLLILMCRQF